MLLPTLPARVAPPMLVAALLASLLGPAPALVAQEESGPLPPSLASASDEGRLAMAAFRVPAGVEVSLFAAEPTLANPVAFCIDHQGRFFICESYRQNRGVTDNRGHDERWLERDLAAQTVADRLKYHQELLGDKVGEYALHDDRIRLVEDTDGDGRADRDTVFADHFHQIEEGTGAGVLAYRGDVFYTCIPNLWRLRDPDGDGRADQRESLHFGYGVRVAFRGHDLHGLLIGPDGRLYFSVGDRGYHVKLPDRTLADPESGAVFRCELDGSQLEIVATGLRNPQELAFDDFGNLFTGDNNSDSGDRARWVYVVEGGDSGWRMSYQYLPDRGPFNREKLWHPFHAEQPASIVPPVANLADGPAGLAYYPGTGLGEQFRGRFFLCDFRGTPVSSGIRTFRAVPRGAFFELADDQQTIWSLLATDLAFGPDGALYVADWVNGWDGEGKGRIYRFARPAAARDPLVQEVRQLLRTGLDPESTDRLIGLLAHADQRVRLEAQFALVRRGAGSALAAVAREHAELLPRLHAIWGLGQLARHDPAAAAVETLATLLQDPEPEVRAQAARVIGDARLEAAVEAVRRGLRDEEPRVRYFAAQAAGRLHARAAWEDVLRMLADNADRDPIVRHGGIMALSGMGDADTLAHLAAHPSRSVRLAAVVALRKLQHPRVARFLRDAEPAVVIEAARAIHDVPIAEALPDLAALIAAAPHDDALVRRVLNANFRLGQTENAVALAEFATRPELRDEWRLEALRMLGDWEQPASRDRVLGMWRPLPPRDRTAARDALRDVVPAVLAVVTDALRGETLDIAVRLGISEVTPALKQLLANAEQPGRLRAAALTALAALRDAEFETLAARSLGDARFEVRLAALRIQAKSRPDDTVGALARATMSSERAERQQAYAILAELKREAADRVIAQGLASLQAGTLPADVELDVVEAARARADQGELKALLAACEQSLNPQEPSSLHRAALQGGDAERGRRIFFERTEVSCVRCHKVAGTGGEVGPELTRIAQQKDRKYLLESIVDPNRAVADNFRSIVVVDADGRIHTGIVKGEDERELRLLTAEGQLEVIPQADIDARADGKSAMPQDVGSKLTQRDLRDLVEWLATLK